MTVDSLQLELIDLQLRAFSERGTTDADGRKVHELEKNRGLLTLAATLVLITVWAQGYYSKKVFHMEGLKYAKYADSGSGSIEYRASFGRGEPIYVHTYEDEKRVEIAGEIYKIRAYRKESGLEMDI